mgnify:CR=1 FL=1
MKLAYCNRRGQLLEHPILAPLGASCGDLWELAADELIPLPAGSTLASLPGRQAVGMTRGGEAKRLSGWAVGALLPAGYLRLLAPAGIASDSEVLPLFGYTAVCFQDGQLKVAALQVEDGRRWAPANFNLPELETGIREKTQLYPDNRLVRHLANCARTYQCFTAQNFFYCRWEAGIPVSGHCNAKCLGCISQQSSDCCPSPQSRIDFTPSLREIVELAADHLALGEDPMVSGGQGCEGDPLLEAELWAEAIVEIRKRTKLGKININTNGGAAAGLKLVAEAGLDAVRIGLVSANPEFYTAYHRPVYDFSQVVASLQTAKEHGVHTALNLLTFPGLTDREGELKRLADLIGRAGVEQLQLRNLNIDPDLMTQFLPYVEGEALGLREFLSRLKEACPALEIGSWSH